MSPLSQPSGDVTPQDGSPAIDSAAPPFWQNLDLSPAYSQVTAFLAAIFAGVLAFFAMLAIVGEHSWATEAIVGVVVAMVWMGVGASFSSAHRVTCALLLVIGSSAARYLSYGILANASLYQGMMTYTLATIAGGAAWASVARRYHRPVAWPIAFTMLVVAVQLSRVTVFGLPGHPRTLYRGNASTEAAIVPLLGSGELTYLWQPAQNGRIQPDSMTASVDLDGSGASPFPMFRVTDTAEQANVCRRLDVRTRQQVSGEVESGSVPRFITAVPVRRWDCSTGTVWRVLLR